MKILRGDTVLVISGDDAADTPRRVIQVIDGGKKIVVEGVNRAFKHVKKGHPKSPQGGRLSLDMPIDTSNVMLYCGSCNKPTRVGFRFASDGAKERFCKKCSATISTVGRAKPQRTASS